MSRLDRHLLGEFLPIFCFLVLFFSSFAIFTSFIPRAQWVSGVPLGRLAAWFSLQLPGTIVPLMPIALVIALLLSFGALSSHNEIVAMRSAGISLRRISSIFIMLGIFLTLGSLLVSQYVIPETNTRVVTLWWQLSSNSNGLWRLASQNLDIGDYSLYFANTDRQNEEMLDVRLEFWDGKDMTVIFAERARFVDDGIQLINFQLNSLDLAALESPTEDAANLLQALIRAENHATEPEQSLTVRLGERYQDIITQDGGGAFFNGRSLTSAYQASQNVSRSADERRDALTYLHNRLNEVFANIILVLIALPLAIQFANNRALAFGLAIGIVFLWYSGILFGQLLVQTTDLPLWLGMWLSSFIFAIVGIFLIARLRNI